MTNDDDLSRYGYRSPGPSTRPIVIQDDGSRWPGIDVHGAGWAVLRILPADLTGDAHVVQLLQRYVHQATHTEKGTDIRILWGLSDRPFPVENGDIFSLTGCIRAGYAVRILSHRQENLERAMFLLKEMSMPPAGEA